MALNLPFTPALLIVPAILGAAPAPLESRAESWGREALKLAQAKGVEALVAEVGNAHGRFAAGAGVEAPELTVYSSGFKVLAVNRPSMHVGMVHAKLMDASGSPQLGKMSEFARKSGPGWYEYLGTDHEGRPKAFKAYVAVHQEHLIAVVVPK